MKMEKCVKMEKGSVKTLLQEYTDSSFPVGRKRTRSAVIMIRLKQRIVNHLKGTQDADGAFRQKERLCIDGLTGGWN